jgi:carboxylesterase
VSFIFIIPNLRLFSLLTLFFTFRHNIVLAFYLERGVLRSAIMTDKSLGSNHFGILIIHGFTATLESISALCEPVKALGVPFRMPLLAGHGASSPEALCGVKWELWLQDADRAFQELAREADQIIVIGHSMGALIALNLAVRYPARVDSLVLVTPALKLVSLLAPSRPLHFAARLVSLMVKRWSLKSDLTDGCKPHYDWVPTETIISFFDLIKKTSLLLSQVDVPFMILHNRREATVLPESAIMLYNETATAPSDKSIIWFERSGHQVFCDCECDKAVRVIIDYLSSRILRKG